MTPTAPEDGNLLPPDQTEMRATVRPELIVALRPCESCRVHIGFWPPADPRCPRCRAHDVRPGELA